MKPKDVKDAKAPLDELLKPVNKILEKEAPEHLVIALEAICGFLRDVKKANNIDVELFMKDHKKLFAHINRKEYTDCRLKNVVVHLPVMEAAVSNC